MTHYAGCEMQVKICGLSRLEDIHAVNTAKPDYCGFILYFPKSRRNISTNTLRALRAELSDTVIPVGVFVDQPPQTIADLLAQNLISIAQLHGHEDETYLSALRRLTDQPIWQAFQIHGTQDILRAEQSTADLILLDAGQGQGKAFPWDLLNGICRPFALAGGITQENLPQAMQTGAQMLDISSGAETNGKKDFDKILSIVTTIRGG